MSPWGINKKHVLIYLAVLLLIYLGALLLLPKERSTDQKIKTGTDSLKKVNGADSIR